MPSPLTVRTRAAPPGAAPLGDRARLGPQAELGSAGTAARLRDLLSPGAAPQVQYVEHTQLSSY